MNEIFYKYIVPESYEIVLKNTPLFAEVELNWFQAYIKDF